MLNFFSAFVMGVVGAIVGAVVVAGSQLLGISGWVTGPVFCLLVLAFIYLNDRVLGFGMRHLIGYLAKLEDTALSNPDKDEIEKSFSRSVDCYAFLAGAVLGILVSLLIAPSLIFNLLPF